MKKVIGILAAALFCASLSAQDLHKFDGGSFFDNELIKVTYGLGGLGLSYSGINSGVAFGVNPSLADEIARDSRAQPLVKSYSSKTMLFWALAIGSVVGAGYGTNQYIQSLSHTSYDPYTGAYTPPDMTGLYILTGSYIALIIAPFVVASADEDLISAVNIYNRDKLAAIK